MYIGAYLGRTCIVPMYILLTRIADLKIVEVAKLWSRPGLARAHGSDLQLQQQPQWMQLVALHFRFGDDECLPCLQFYQAAVGT